MGACSDNINPAVRFTLGDQFWVDNGGLEPMGNNTGCGYDLSEYPGITPLGGWDADTVSLAYIDVGQGRFWLVEADWQDRDVGWDDDSQFLMQYMIMNGRR